MADRLALKELSCTQVEISEDYEALKIRVEDMRQWTVEGAADHYLPRRKLSEAAQHLEPRSRALFRALKTRLAGKKLEENHDGNAGGVPGAARAGCSACTPSIVNRCAYQPCCAERSCGTVCKILVSACRRKVQRPGRALCFQSTRPNMCSKPLKPIMISDVRARPPCWRLTRGCAAVKSSRLASVSSN